MESAAGGAAGESLPKKLGTTREVIKESYGVDYFNMNQDCQDKANKCSSCCIAHCTKIVDSRDQIYMSFPKRRIAFLNRCVTKCARGEPYVLGVGGSDYVLGQCTDRCREFRYQCIDTPQ